MQCKFCGKALTYQKKFCSRNCLCRFNANIQKITFKGKNNPFYNKKHTKETIEKNRIAHLGKIGNWKGGISANDPIAYRRRKRKEWGVKNKDKIKRYKQLYHCRRRASGWPTLADIQLVYEDNIKQYGTLTCYLCNKVVNFGKDSIDHIIPVFSGGSNERSNLAIAHRVCNSIKNKRRLEDVKIS